MKTETKIRLAFAQMMSEEPIVPNPSLNRVLKRIEKTGVWRIQSVNDNGTIELVSDSGTIRKGVHVAAIRWNTIEAKAGVIKDVLKNIPSFTELENEVGISKGKIGRFLRGLCMLDNEEISRLIPVLREKGFAI